ncbi:MAG: helix-turn-helix domain-containing protein [Bacteroidota bacterium]
MIQIPFNLPTLLIGAVIAQGIFAGALLLLRRNNPVANRFLGSLLLTFSFWLVDPFFNVAEVYQQNPNYYFLPIFFSFGFGPLVYFYTVSLTEKDFRFRRSDYWHFLPVLIQFLSYCFLQTQSYAFRRAFWFEVHQAYTQPLEFYLSLLSLLSYLVLSIRRVKKYQRWINNQFSEVSQIDLQWLKMVLGLTGLLAIIVLSEDLLLTLLDINLAQTLSITGLGLAILILGGGGLLQKSLRQIGLIPAESKPEKISKTEPLQTDLLRQIQSAMEEERYFLDPSLTLASFAEQLNQPARLVSQHINQGLSLSFIDFVNQYRVNAFKQHLMDGDLDHLSLLGIAFESGFNSKSTFNRVFRKMTGESPSAYKNRAQNA